MGSKLGVLLLLSFMLVVACEYTDSSPQDLSEPPTWYIFIFYYQYSIMTPSHDHRALTKLLLHCMERCV